MNRYLFFLLFLMPSSLFAQLQTPVIIDQIVAVVGSKGIKQSDIENGYIQTRSQGMADYANLKCDILESLLKQKLFMNQAMVDSVIIPESQVEGELSNRLNMEISRVGSVEKIEKQYNKTMSQIKDDFRESMREMLTVQKMQQTIVEKMKITPSEVKAFYNKIPKDSIPKVDAHFQYAQLAIYPAYSERSVLEVKDKLLDLRKRILAGESFAALAAFYSEDEGTAKKGGETGLMSKADFDDPDYAKAAFVLSKPGDISRIVESKFGFLIMQLIEHIGDKVNTRVILLKPKPDPEAVFKVKSVLDSITGVIRKGTLTFGDAVKHYSMDEDTRFNMGMAVNPQTGNTGFTREQLAPVDYYAVKNLKIGEISSPYESRDRSNKVFYKIVTLVSQTPAHQANLQDDYDLLQDIAKNSKRAVIMEDWVTDKVKSTYISIDKEYKNCIFSTKGWLKAGK